MSVKYHVVKKKDMSKGAPKGAQLYYGQVRAGERVTLDEISGSIAALSTASEGDVSMVLEGLLLLMRQNLLKGNLIELGALGNFHIIASSRGVKTEEDFDTALFRRGKLRYSPGKMLKEVTENIHYEKYKFVEKEEKCDQPHVE